MLTLPQLLKLVNPYLREGYKIAAYKSFDIEKNCDCGFTVLGLNIDISLYKGDNEERLEQIYQLLVFFQEGMNIGRKLERDDHGFQVQMNSQD